MNNTLKISCISLALFGCLSKNIELKPVKNKTDCLINKIITISGTRPDLVTETQNISYDENGNPIDWSILDASGSKLYQIKMKYENNRLKTINKYDYDPVDFLFDKSFEINDNFTEMKVRTYRKGYQNKDEVIQKLHFKRNKQKEIKFLYSEQLDLKDTSKVIAKVYLYVYNEVIFNGNIFSPPNISDTLNNVKRIVDYNFTQSNVKTVSYKGYWDNVRNPFSANIWLSLIANYNKVPNTDFKKDGGDWNLNMPTTDPVKGFITTYETNAEGFPCRLTAKNKDFTPYPLEIKYYYLNCDCK